MQHIVIIGTGFAGLWSALSAKRLINAQNAQEAIEVTIISPEPKLVMRPRLYEPNAKGMITPLTDLFQKTGIKFIAGTVSKIDVPSRTVELKHGDTVVYDRLVLAAGSRLRLPPINGFAEHAFSIDTLDDASTFEAHLENLASLPPSAARNIVVVVGGGFTGIEVAAELPARLRTILGRHQDVRVVVVERNDEIGPPLGTNPRPVIERALREQGVEFKLGGGISSISKTSVILSTGERIQAATVLWTAGVEASPLTAQISGEKDRLGRIHVDSSLRVPDAAEIFVAGDAAHADTDGTGHMTLMSCQHATPLGRFAGYNAAADLLGLERKEYRQPYYGTCLDLGGWGALVTEGWERAVMYQGAEAKGIKRWIMGL
ncbi:NAD(P)/FAD-dependent oxidoreductase [Aspergillus undulatus]|uniref:NAD(P)/FAD-dependent oxidoreductase n=1 Tax=Aspergillus undulatus TaxID=1810928 RepID=UPI003CCDD5E2